MRRTLVTVGLLALVTACTPGGGDDSSSTEPDTGPGGVYAYKKVEFGQDWLQTKTTLVLMDGTERVASAELFLGTAPLFTVDRRYVFTAATIGDTITAISVETGTITTLTCEDCGDTDMQCLCQMVVPIGGSSIAWLNKKGRLVTADLAANPAAGTETDTAVPLEDGFLDEKLYPALLAGKDGVALAAYPSGGLPGDDFTPAYLVTPGQKPRRLDVGREDAMEMAAFSPDGTKVAIGGDREYVCATVTVVDLASGKGTTAPVKAEPGAKCEQRDLYVTDLWWDYDGALNAYYQLSEDGRSGAEAHRRLDGERFTPVGAEPTTRTHRLSTGGAVVVVDRVLFWDGGSGRIQVDTDVAELVAS